MKKDNNMYNIMIQLTQEQKSLWRIEKMYLKDAGKDKMLKEFWTELVKEKKEIISILEDLVKAKMK